KRKERDLEEINARAKLPITAAAMVHVLDDEDIVEVESFMPAICDHHAAPRPARRLRVPKPVSAAAHQLAEELDHREEQESAEERFARALRLEALPADEIDEENARWLSIYRTSAEYAGRMLIHEEGAGDDAPTPSNGPARPFPSTR
ncbi:MAG: hypothetical protein KGL35_08830, partial [Bradyrhizobium sp.]|nr:hypothetical protein [Bradyrhizobium sp.]